MDSSTSPRDSRQSSNQSLVIGHRPREGRDQEETPRRYLASTLDANTTKNRKDEPNSGYHPPYEKNQFSRYPFHRNPAPLSRPARSLTTNPRLLERHNIPSLPRKEDQPSPPPPTSTPVALGQNTLKTAHDIKMASRQAQIETLAPAERKAQEEWAQRQLQQNEGNCVAGFSWYRVEGGYRCRGGRHMVTDELLAEGEGGCYSSRMDSGMRESPVWEGPFYGAEIRAHMYAYVDPSFCNKYRRGSMAGFLGSGRAVPPSAGGQGSGLGGRARGMVRR